MSSEAWTVARDAYVRAREGREPEGIERYAWPLSHWVVGALVGVTVSRLGGPRWAAWGLGLATALPISPRPAPVQELPPNVEYLFPKGFQRPTRESNP